MIANLDIVYGEKLVTYPENKRLMVICQVEENDTYCQHVMETIGVGGFWIFQITL